MKVAASLLLSLSLSLSFGAHRRHVSRLAFSKKKKGKVRVAHEELTRHDNNNNNG
jgi:hypothetical protein